MHTVSKLQAFRHPRNLLLAGLLAVAAGGCETATGTGAAAGGALGAGIGALAGHCPGAALAGGLIGAGAGAPAPPSIRTASGRPSAPRRPRSPSARRASKTWPA
jgi:hypothetical protein